MDRKELEKKIRDMTKKAETERKKREYLVIGAFAIIFFVIYCLFENVPETFGAVIGVFISTIALSALYCAIHYAIFRIYLKRMKLLSVK